MSKEKLTIERLSSNIEIELKKEIGFETSPYVIAEIQNFINQIRDEILDLWVNSRDKDFDDIIDEVFDKYLNEK